MFGYATNETPELMPLTLILSHKLNKKMADLRRNGELGWLRPDSKTQVTVEYEKKPNGAVVPLRVDTVVISTQHAEEISTEDLQKELIEKVVKTVIPANLLDAKTVYHIQPSGRFVIGGPQGDAGLTGRKIIVDTYGGWGAHGGGAFSGKDWSKVDRSAAYVPFLFFLSHVEPFLTLSLETATPLAGSPSRSSTPTSPSVSSSSSPTPSVSLSPSPSSLTPTDPSRAVALTRTSPRVRFSPLLSLLFSDR
jgi:hypothetical protein